jgi:acyl-[acyl-carrier-protein]-phospholipid O-acyltransferase/long-chain-fatty-acid--[acyl-carrier-protein] ligase
MTEDPAMRSEPDTRSGFLLSRRFLPLFATQFLGAFNDNFFRFAMATMILFELGGAAGLDGAVLVNLAAAAFMLPFFLLSGIAGQISDRFDKSRVIRWVKLFEIVCMAVAALGFVLGDAWVLMGALVLMGTQSTFFGPVKYGILPDHLAEDELVAANGVIEAGTYLAILLGTIAGIQAMSLSGGDARYAALSVVALAVAGTVTGFLVPPTAAAAPDLRLDPNVFAQTGRMIAHAAERRDIFLSILGISWFWLIGLLFLSQMQTLTTDVIRGGENLTTVFMAVFSVGIGVGSLLCAKILKGEVSAATVPLGALGMALFSFDLFLACDALPASAQAVTTAAFFAGFAGWRIAADLALIAVFGGLFIVPLYVIVQARSDEAHRARTNCCGRSWRGSSGCCSGSGSRGWRIFAASATGR